jgi:thiamine biosynthesis protein ThiS
MITINGKPAELSPGLTVEELLLREGFNTERVVVERNKEIVPREQYTATVLWDGDSVEILQFVGGG